ncbi:DUF4132 domain-containing protein [Kribbella sp. NPDC050459]|uniref:DUF4132 domain-containing protein n=1 Tax=Kribbella sp. NPDC050459 TaxID=3155785 RepID=UPI0033E00959
MTATTVPANLESALRLALKPIADGDADLHEDLVSYVLTGARQSLLGRLGGYDVTWKLGVIAHGEPAEEAAVKRFLGGLAELPIEVVGRWATLLGTALTNTSHYFPRDMAGQPPWIGALLLQLGNLPAVFSHERFEELLVAAGLDPATMLLIAFEIPAGHTGYFPDHRVSAVVHLPGYEDAVRRNLPALRAGLTLDKVAHQQSALPFFTHLSAELQQELAPELAGVLASSNRQVRTDAQRFLAVDGVLGELRVLAEKGKPEQRIEALKLLWATDDEEQRQWAEKVAGADRAASVRKLLDTWAFSAQEEASVPDIRPVDLRVPVTDELRSMLGALWVHIMQGNHTFAGSGDELSLTEDDLRQVLTTLETGVPCEIVRRRVPQNWLALVLGEHAAEMGPIVSTVVLARTGVLMAGWNHLLTEQASGFYNSLFQETGHPTLLELALILDAMGLDGSALVADRYKRSYNGLATHWPDEAVAPFVRHALPHFLEMLEINGDYYMHDDMPFRALATLPTLPGEAVEALTKIALRPQKGKRRAAQDMLARIDGFEERPVAALKDTKAEVRAVAAQWLQRLRYEPAVPALEAAIAKEKNDVTTGALLDALESFGRPVEKYVDRDGLRKDAGKGLAKGLPKGLEWMRWDLLPKVHWADSGDAVPPEVLKWLIAQAVKAKSPEPNALLRKYCGMFDPAEREEFGQHLLETWLAQDVVPISQEEAHRLASEAATWQHSYLTRYPQQNASSPLAGMNLAQITAYLLPRFASRPAGSAIASKGVLAVAAACAGERAAAPVGRYLKEWYGTRAAQGKALIAMLAWIEDPSAIQLMLSVGSRFRTKSFQDEATRQAEALAERKGWTINELADRSVPVAGLDEDGRIDLSYGDRVFTAVLQPDLTVALLSPEGNKLKALPAARQTDDADAVKAAKKAFSAAKRELKAVVQLQTDRLYEALCTERTWPFEDWQRYLNGHPIMRRLLQRLAWVADGKTVFRPLDDGSLTDVDDNEVEFRPDAVVRIAHDTVLDEDTVRGWQQHFDDYEIVPLFQQFGKGIFRLPAERADTQVLNDFEGHLVEAFALRGRTGKLGYTRGTAQDAGWFYEYEKRFPTLGLVVEVGFSGNPLPEQNRTVALGAVRVLRSADGPGIGTVVRLGDVPSVLLSEVYNDVRLMASDGPGFDPDWQQKTEY